MGVLDHAFRAIVVKLTPFLTKDPKAKNQVIMTTESVILLN